MIILFAWLENKEIFQSKNEANVKMKLNWSILNRKQQKTPGNEINRQEHRNYQKSSIVKIMAKTKLQVIHRSSTEARPRLHTAGQQARVFDSTTESQS